MVLTESMTIFLLRYLLGSLNFQCIVVCVVVHLLNSLGRNCITLVKGLIKSVQPLQTPDMIGSIDPWCHQYGNILRKQFFCLLRLFSSTPLTAATCEYTSFKKGNCPWL